MEHKEWKENPLRAVFVDSGHNITTVSACIVQLEKRRWDAVNDTVYVTDFEKKCAELEIPKDQVKAAIDSLKPFYG